MSGTFKVQPEECFGCLLLNGLTFQSLTFQGRLWKDLTQKWTVHPQAVTIIGYRRNCRSLLMTNLGASSASSLIGKLEHADLVLTVKRQAPDSYQMLLDSKQERTGVDYFLNGLAIWLRIPDFDEAVLLIGRRDHNRTHVLPFALKPGFKGSISQLRRINSGIAAFLEACPSSLHEVRIHRYVRAIESFLPPSAWGERQFADNIGILCGSNQRATEAAREIYRLRNKVEHHEYFECAKLSGPVPDETAWLRAWQAEVLCLELNRRLFTGGDTLLKSLQRLGLHRRLLEGERPYCPN